MRYYVVVEACNGVDLCSLMYSDGIILDKTPPVTGLVTIGQSKHESYIPDKWVVYIFHPISQPAIRPYTYLFNKSALIFLNNVKQL